MQRLFEDGVSVIFLLVLRPLFDGGVYLKEAFIRVITVIECVINFCQ